MRLIDADEFYKEISSTYFFEPNKLFVIENAIKNAPTIDAAPVVRGKWVEHESYGPKRCRLIECSNCGKKYMVSCNVPYCDWIQDRNYCALCGACMKEEE